MMVELAPLDANDLATWWKLQEELKRIKAAESLLRARIFRHYFLAPKEGVNSFPLPDESGWVLKGEHKINRAIDEPALAAAKDALLQAGMSVDKLVVYKPELATREYRTLTAEQRNLFDQCLIIKEGTPGLEIVLPAKARKE
jgi:hypothetical protein